MGSIAIEQRNEDTFKANAKKLRDELFRRSNAAANPPACSTTE